LATRRLNFYKSIEKDLDELRKNTIKIMLTVENAPFGFNFISLGNLGFVITFDSVYTKDYFNDKFLDTQDMQYREKASKDFFAFYYFVKSDFDFWQRMGFYDFYKKMKKELSEYMRDNNIFWEG
ncbi:MAG: hypothetical protein LUF31_06030, partial [Fusobacterium sp.]|nr:hypothetical protein [Fusobacterium sp.]